MNTYRLYIVDVYRIIKSDFLEDDKNITILSKGIPSRKTVVYDDGYGCYYDLIAKELLHVGLSYSPVGSEYIKQDSFVSFNDYLHNKKENLSKRKIKKLYIEHKNNVNNK